MPLNFMKIIDEHTPKKILNRPGFIEYWVNYMRKHSDREWSRQQNVLINSVLKSCHQPSRKEYLELKNAKRARS